VTLQRLTIRRPDDWHVHLRDGEMLAKVAPHTARQFARAIIMPNLVPPVTSVEAAAAYRGRIIAAAGEDFTPLMTCYLTDNVDPEELARGYADGTWVAAKLYPAGATTNSASGVTDIRTIYPALERMQQIGMVFCIHGEVTDPEVDVFDRETVFVDRILSPLVSDFPELKMVLEHITTKHAAEFVAAAPANVAATITPQHLHLNRNALFKGGLRARAGPRGAQRLARQSRDGVSATAAACASRLDASRGRWGVRLSFSCTTSPLTVSYSSNAVTSPSSAARCSRRRSAQRSAASATM